MRRPVREAASVDCVIVVSQGSEVACSHAPSGADNRLKWKPTTRLCCTAFSTSITRKARERDGRSSSSYPPACPKSSVYSAPTHTTAVTLQSSLSAHRPITHSSRVIRRRLRALSSTCALGSAWLRLTRLTTMFTPAGPSPSHTSSTVRLAAHSERSSLF